MDKTRKIATRTKYIAAGGALFLVQAIINGVIIFREGWHFQGFDIPYLYTALQKYHDSLIQVSGFYNSFVAMGYHDNISSPLYYLAEAIAQIGHPSPPWFRLTGTFALLCIFLAAYFTPSAMSPRIDRIVTAVTVTSTPAVLFVCRYLDDYAMHMFLLIVGAALIVKSENGKNRKIFLPFYFLPVVAFWMTFMVTHFLIAMVSLGGMYCYSLFWRLRDGNKKIVKIIVGEIPWIAVSLLLVFLTAKTRGIPSGESLFSYYSSEAGAYLFPGTSLVDHLLSYPGALFFSSVGVITCLLALANVIPKFRSTDALLYLIWMAAPLLILTAITKKNHYYIWFAVPAISILAASTVTRFPVRWKTIWIGACLLFSVMHLFHFASPLEELSDNEIFESGNIGMNMDFIDRNEQNRIDDFANAQKVLALAEKCGSINGRNFVSYHPDPFNWRPVRLYFAMLTLNQGPIYWFVASIPKEVADNAVIVRLDSGYAIRAHEKIQDDLRSQIFSTHSQVFQTSDYRVFCPTLNPEP